MRDEPSAAVPTPDSPGPASATRVELTICPYLRAVAPDDSLGEPVRWPHPDNRCVALGMWRRSHLASRDSPVSPVPASPAIDSRGRS